MNPVPANTTHAAAPLTPTSVTKFLQHDRMIQRKCIARAAVCCFVYRLFQGSSYARSCFC